MTFAHPWMLLGAVAAFIPLLIHLFDRRRPRPHPFGAIAFVLRSQRQTASRLKLKRLLLYLLRTLILLALPVALARPEMRRERGAAVSARGPAATSIILDASFSMQFRDGGTTLFERGRQLAREALRDLRPHEPANVLLCTPAAMPPSPPSFDRARLRNLIDEAKPSYGSSVLNTCMQLAARSLEESTVPGKRMVLISDLAAHAFRLELPPPIVQGPKGESIRPEVVIADAAQGRSALPNHAIVDLKVQPSAHAGPKTFQFSFAVRNFTDQVVKDLECSLKVGEQVVAKGFLDIPPRGTAQKTLTYRFNAGGPASGTVSVARDSLEADDQRAFLLEVPKELRALVVNGAPSSLRYRDEAFFVETALAAAGSPVRAVVRDPDAASREAFEQYDLVLLLNVSAPTPDVARRLTDFVQRGGGLFISMGDRIEPDAYNQKLGSLLPRALRLVKTAAPPDAPDADRKAARFSQVAWDHPLFSPFSGRAREGLIGARFYRYMLLEPEAAASRSAASEVLATYDDGAPVLAIARRGQGRVLLYTSTVDRDWTDFPIRTSFLPLIQRFSSLLSGSLEEREELQARIGGFVSLITNPQQGIATVRAPSGAEVRLQKKGEGSATVGPLEEPGLHQVLDASGKPIPALGFVATLIPSESDLSRIKLDELSAYFGQDVVKTAYVESEQHRVPFWSWLIVTAALAFFFEGTLLRK